MNNGLFSHSNIERMHFGLWTFSYTLDKRWIQLSKHFSIRNAFAVLVSANSQHIIVLSAPDFYVYVLIDDSVPTLRMFVDVKLEWYREGSERDDNLWPYDFADLVNIKFCDVVSRIQAGHKLNSGDSCDVQLYYQKWFTIGALPAKRRVDWIWLHVSPVTVVQNQHSVVNIVDVKQHQCTVEWSVELIAFGLTSHKYWNSVYHSDRFLRSMRRLCPRRQVFECKWPRPFHVFPIFQGL